MFKSYLRSASRNLFKHKLNSLINILGLSVGFAVAILIFLYIQHERSYDKWIPDSDQVYRAYRSWEGGGETVWTPGPLAYTVREELPEVLQATGLSVSTDVLLQNGEEKVFMDQVAVVDSTFFEVIPFELTQGQAEEVLKLSQNIVLSERLAEQLFGKEDPIGKTIKVDTENDYVVSGVLTPLAGNTQLTFEAYVRYGRASTRWVNNNRSTFLKVRKDASIEQLESKITALVTPFLKQANRESGRSPDATNYPNWGLQSMHDIHLHPLSNSWFAFNRKGGNIKYLYIFGMIGLIMLIVACINYINLTTASSTQRAMEIGVRKVSGAGRGQLINQFMVEALLQTSIAFVLSLALAELFLPFFNSITDRSLHFLEAGIQSWILYMAGLALLVGSVAGIVPALIISAFKPGLILKRSLDRGLKGNFFRRALVMVQFGVSVVLFVFRQVNFMMTKDLGFSSEQVVVVPLNLSSSAPKVEALKGEFQRIPGVSSISTSSSVPGQPLPDWGVIVNGETLPNVFMSWVDADYAETLDLEMQDGRFFSRDIASDTLNAFVVNEAFLREANLEDPFETQVRFTYSSEDEGANKIVGVVKDFHFRGLDRSIGPMIMMYQPNYRVTSIKVATENLDGSLKAIENLWGKVEPDHPFRYSFLDEDFAEQYAEQERFGDTMLYATLLTIFIGVLGLFGLATHSTTRRTKEIGIRKVVGATVNGIVFMLVKDFTRWVFWASLFALPLGYWLITKWLEDFAFQIDITPYPFLLAIGLAMGIAVLTVCYQAIRTALANPIESLRHE